MKLPLWRQRQDEELDEELRGHLKMAAEDRVACGASQADAEQAARRELGNTGLIKEATRESWGWTWLERLGQDLRYGVRVLMKSKGYAAIAILTLALGIGINTALFSVVNGVLLRPLPFPNSDELVTLHESKANFEKGSIPWANFRDWRKDNQTFQAMAVARVRSFTMTGRGEGEQIRGEYLSSGFFSLLGVKPLVGRDFAPGEDEKGAPPQILVSEGFWKRKLGSAKDVLSQHLTLDGKDYTIIGVIPANFHLLIPSFQDRDVYVPIGQWGNNALENRGAGLGIHGIGRLKAGMTLEQAQADLQRVSANLAAEFPDTNKGVSASMVPLKEQIVGEVRPFLLVLLAAVGCVLLIACVNVANLLLARSTARTREFAVRAALGASRMRMVRQLLTESTLLALTGGVLGLLLAAWGTKAALGVLPMELPRSEAVGLDGQVLLFTSVISIVAGLLFALVPALKMSDRGLHDTLKEGGRGTSGVRFRALRVFVVVEMATALVLLIGAGLMIRTLAELWSVDPGFEAAKVLNVGITLPPPAKSADPVAARAMFRSLQQQLNATPGVESSALTWEALPFAGDDEKQFWLDGQPKPASDSEMNWAIDYIVSPDYLKVMGTPLKRGRFLTDQDNEHSPRVVVVDEALADKFFPNQDPIGRRINLNGAEGSAQIVGVVGHVKQWGLDEESTDTLKPQLYLACMQAPDDYVGTGVSTGVMLRARGSVKGLTDSVRNMLRANHPGSILFGVQTMEEMVSESLAGRRFMMVLLGIFAALALILASVGIYGVISYLVGQRTHEIGVRMALGAQPQDIVRLILGQGLTLALIGVVAGCAAALGLTRLLTDLLYRVKPVDPMTFAGVATLLCGVAIAACYVPARRAMRVDPTIALRYE